MLDRRCAFLTARRYVGAVQLRPCVCVSEMDTHDWALRRGHRRHLVLDAGKLQEHRHHGHGDADLHPVTSLPAHLGGYRLMMLVAVVGL